MKVVGDGRRLGSLARMSSFYGVRQSRLAHAPQTHVGAISMTNSEEEDKKSAVSDVSPGLSEDFLENILKDAKPEVKEILLDPAILNRYKQALDRLITGEDKSKLLLFLICLTSYMRKVLGAIIMGESSAGKSHLMNSVLKFFNNVEEYTRMTQASPDRIAMDFKDKILKVEELRGTERAQSSLRVWISEGKLRLLTTTRDEDGKLTTEVLETNGVPCFITTTTCIRPDEELLNRLFLISIDETEAQTRKVLDYEALQFMDPDFEEKSRPPQDLVEALECIAVTPFYEILIPFAHELSKRFPSKSVKARRDFKKLLYIIGSVAFLHQLQRPIVYKVRNRQYIVALPVDFLIAWKVAEQGMKETLMNIQKRSLDVLELFREPNVESFTSRQVATATRLSQNRAREILNGLVDFGYLVKDRSQKEHLFSLKGKIDEDNTISDFETSCLNFGEKKLEEWLVDKNLKTRYRVCLPTTYVNPIDGVELPIPPGRVLKKSETEPKEGVKQQKSRVETSKTVIVPSLHDSMKSITKIEPHVDQCANCQKVEVLHWQIESFKSEWGHVCQDCGSLFQDILKKTER
jgi:hypothetical protein